MGQENIWLIALLGFAGFLGNVAYCMGGTRGFGLVWRRYIGAAVLTLACNLAAVYLSKWVWQYLLVFPCLLGGFSLGYGADTWWEKAIKRGLFALGVSMAVLCGVWATGFTVFGWVVFGISIALGSMSIVLGVLNPLTNAPLEQFIISQLLTMFVPFLVFIR